MKTEGEVPNIEGIKKECLAKIKKLEFELCYNKLISKEERDQMWSEMWYLTRKFNFPYTCQNA